MSTYEITHEDMEAETYFVQHGLTNFCAKKVYQFIFTNIFWDMYKNVNFVTLSVSLYL